MTKTNTCVEKDALIDYLYGEGDAEARTRVEAHLRSCARCADEVGGLRDVRGTLDAWVPPETRLGFRVVSDAHSEPASVSFWGRFQRPPVWGLAMAAVLLLAAAATVARSEVQVGPDGIVVRIGWSAAEPAGCGICAVIGSGDRRGGGDGGRAWDAGRGDVPVSGPAAVWP